MKKSIKLGGVVIALGIGISSLTACSGNLSNSDPIYTDANKVLTFATDDLQKGITSFTPSQQKQVDAFMGKYQSLSMDDPRYKVFENTISSLDSFVQSGKDSSSSDNTDSTSSDTSQSPIMVNGHNISIGMSMNDVENALGKPYDDNQTVASGDTQDQLVYNNMLGQQEYYLYFDNGTLNSIQDEK